MLKHRVDGTEAVQSHLEADFMAHPQIDQTEGVRRIYLGNQGPSDVDGWATVVELVIIAPLLVVIGQFTGVHAVDRRLTEVGRRRLTAARKRVSARHFLLIVVVAGLLLGVRIAGILLERQVTWLSMHAIAALLYPIIAVGILAAAYGIASGLERRIDAAVTAALGLAVAIWLDYAYLGVDALPIDVVVQRALVIVALGLIAGGAARRARRESRWKGLLLVGTGLWLVLLVGTLLGWI